MKEGEEMAKAVGSELSAGLGVMRERQRQIEEEGWTPEHDDRHRYGELAIAAARYAVAGTDATVEDPHDVEGWIKLKDRRSNLIRAGALIIAEIERIDRRSAGNRTGYLGNVNGLGADPDVP